MDINYYIRHVTGIQTTGKLTKLTKHAVSW